MPSSIKNHAVLWVAVILAFALILVAVLLPRAYGAEPLEWWNGVFQAGQLQQPKETLRSSDRTAKVIAHEDFKPDIAVLRIRCSSALTQTYQPIRPIPVPLGQPIPIQPRNASAPVPSKPTTVLQNPSRLPDKDSAVGSSGKKAPIDYDEIVRQVITKRKAETTLRGPPGIQGPPGPPGKSVTTEDLQDLVNSSPIYVELYDTDGTLIDETTVSLGGTLRLQLYERESNAAIR
jgi:hypothetical protein